MLMSKIMQKQNIFFGKTIELSPEFPYSYINLANTLERFKEYEKAIEILKTFISLQSSSNESIEEAYLKIGQNYECLGEFNKTIYYYKKTLELNNKSFKAFNNIGSLFFQTGNIMEALNSFKKALSLNQSFTLAFNNIIFTLQNIQNTPELETNLKEFNFYCEHNLKKFESYTNKKDINKKIKIGYISPDFREHIHVHIFFFL